MVNLQSQIDLRNARIVEVETRITALNSYTTNTIEGSEALHQAKNQFNDELGRLRAEINKLYAEFEVASVQCYAGIDADLNAEALESYKQR